MNGLQFENVVILLVDPDVASRDSIKSILRNNGFRDIRTGTTVDNILSGIDGEPIDLLICEAKFQDGDPCELIRALRHHEVGHNPFLPIIMTTWEPTEEVVEKVVESGADDLIGKPISSSYMLGRIKALIGARKPFVVTSDYIGPDRRTAENRPSSASLLKVPNTLQAKVTGGLEAHSLQRSISETMAEINLRKLERHGVQIGVLVELILPAYESGEIDQRLTGNLERLLYVAEDTSRRLGGTKYDHVSDLCQTLITVTNAIRKDIETPNQKDLKLLRPLSKAVRAAFDVTDDVAAIARQISATVSDDKARKKIN